MMKYIPLIGRFLFSIIFIYSSVTNFSDVFITEAAHKGLPFANVIVPLVGVFQLAAGLSILFGFLAKWGAWVIVILLIPISLIIHDFWNIDDPLIKQLVLLTFMKNFAIIGASLMIAYFGSGPFSLDGSDLEENQDDLDKKQV